MINSKNNNQHYIITEKDEIKQSVLNKLYDKLTSHKLLKTDDTIRFLEDDDEDAIRSCITNELDELLQEICHDEELQAKLQRYDMKKEYDNNPFAIFF